MARLATKLSIIGLLLALLCCYGFMFLGGRVPAAGDGDIYTEDFEFGSDGDDLDTDAAWTDDATDKFEIDTALAHAGSRSALITLVSSGDNECYSSFTEQTTKFTVEFWVYCDITAGVVACYPIIISDGVFTLWDSWGVTDAMAIAIHTHNGQVYVWGGSEFDTNQSIADSTWTKIEIEMDDPNNQFSIWVGGVAGAENPYAYHTSNLSPDRINLTNYASTTPVVNISIDDIRIYAGARQ